MARVYGWRPTQDPDKDQSVSLNNAAGAGAIEQTFYATPGARVTVKFKASRATSSDILRDMYQAFYVQLGKDPTSRKFYPLGAASDISYERPPTPPDNSLPGYNEKAEWKEYTFSYTANKKDGTEALRFMAGNGTSYGPLITDIKVTETATNIC